MRDGDKHELFRLIQNEIDFGFTFLDTAALASSREHTEQAFQDAKSAWQTATRFLGRLTEQEASAFLPRLGDLEAAIKAR